MIQYQLSIATVYQSNPADEARRGGEETLHFVSMAKLKEELFKRYPNRDIKGLLNKNKVYVERDNQPIHVGFTISYWNSDVSHNSKSWWQTDWVNIERLDIQPAVAELMESL